MKELLCFCGLVLIFMMFIYFQLIESYKSRIAYLQEEVKDYQDFILNLLKGGVE